ncbi:MAG: EAL domain-containing protein [Thermodesulfovibrionales bacterium]|nr:EAL domain-containing protein [Thermodesulfovibrionales bacterium]
MKFIKYAKFKAIILGVVFFFSSHLAAANSSLEVNERSTFLEHPSFIFLFISLTLLLIAILQLLQYRRQIEKKSLELSTANKQLQIEIEERAQIHTALQESKERYALAARGANDGLWDWNLKTNEIYFSSRWKSMLGFQDDEIEDRLQEWFHRVHPDDINKLKKDISDHLNEGTSHFKNEHRLLNKKEDYLWVLSRGLAVRDTDGSCIRMAGSLTDITGRKKTEEQLIQNAFYDTLTGLPNRALFMDRLQMAFVHNKRNKDHLFAILFLDLDRFKNINDSFGHLIGDELLVLVAKRLRFHIRPDDTIARFGGDEFVVLLGNIKEVSDATKIAERINNVLTEPFHLMHHELYISITIGIAVSTHEYQQPEEILRDADTAMYHAKLRGNACYLVFDKLMHVNALDRLELEIDLRHAIERKEFVLYYQPIISLENRSIIGFEALVRWNHPRRGFLLPMEFIPLAEETGLIIPLSLWIIREACRQILIWQQQISSESPLVISINISPKHFKNDSFVDQIINILDETKLNPEHLALEITETVIMDNTDHMIAVLSQLKDLGIKIHIDDFGTGYSSLSYLQRFPINTLKIDRSFIGRLSGTGKDIEIVQSIINMAHNMKLHVIAEGVENAENLKTLENLKCEYAQGYFFSHPLNINDAEVLIAQHNAYTNVIDYPTSNFEER